MKKSLAILLAVLMTLTLFACQPIKEDPDSQDPDTAGDVTGTDSPDDPTTAARDTLTVALTSDSGTLDAAVMTGDVFAAVASIMEPLWDVTE